MSDEQTLFMQLIGLAILSGIAFKMLYAAGKAARNYFEGAAGIAKRFPVLVSMLGALVALPVALILAFVLGGA